MSQVSDKQPLLLALRQFGDPPRPLPLLSAERRREEKFRRTAEFIDQRIIDVAIPIWHQVLAVPPEEGFVLPGSGVDLHQRSERILPKLKFQILMAVGKKDLVLERLRRPADHEAVRVKQFEERGLSHPVGPGDPHHPSEAGKINGQLAAADEITQPFKPFRFDRFDNHNSCTCLSSFSGDSCSRISAFSRTDSGASGEITWIFWRRVLAVAISGDRTTTVSSRSTSILKS